jgi:DNA-binding IclR family transcriptional regulator
MSRWVARGEWEDVPAIAERGYGRNAAEEAAGYRHSRATIGGQVRQWCAALECPGLAEELLRRTHEMTVAARAVTAGGAA